MTTCRRLASGSERKKIFALFAVALLTVSLLVVIIGNGVGSDSGDGWNRTVTYHSDESDSGTEVSYDGIASAEYNPVYWNSDNGKDNWVAPAGDYDLTIEIDFDFTTYFWNRTGSFSISLGDNITVDSVDPRIDNGTISPSPNGSTYSFDTYSSDGGGLDSTYTHSGTVTFDVRITAFSTVFAGWSTASGSEEAEYEPGDIIPDGVEDLYAVWINPSLYSTHSRITSNGGSTTVNAIAERPYNSGGYTTLYDSGSVYGTICTVSGTQTISGTLASGTYRSASGSGSVMSFSGRVAMSGDVVIDSMVLTSATSSTERHGDYTGAGLYANGHKLIIGTNVTAQTGIDANRYLQVYGGHWSNSISADGEEYATDVVIFGGTYYNVVAGSHSSTIVGDTRLVMRGGIVLDTVIGGNSGNTGMSTSGSQNRIDGSTYVYMLGSVRMPGDYYEESLLGGSGLFEGIPSLTESTILTGGSNNGYISGDTHVYVSNDAELWDVQAGGRRGQSTVVGTAHAEVSGDALIKHVLCGSITDGIESSDVGDRASVGSTDLKVRDGAYVGSVFGAGYDTYYSATYASMLGEESTISIEVSGSSTVGYVYGGGYRGTIGTESDPIGSISITVSGGTVLGDVFGGGRGGLDKILHNTNGSFNDGSSHNDTTGFSRVYANSISIRVTGGTVNGGVYGGGESVPVITAYNGSSLSGSPNTGVASVECTSVRISITGGSVGGSVYGAGKGVDEGDLDYYDADGNLLDGTDGASYSIHSTAYIFAMTRDGGIVKIPWVSGSTGTVLPSGMSGTYYDYASVEGNIAISMSGSSVSGDVYGGGQYGRIGGPVTVTGGNVSGSAATHTITISLGSGASITGGVYGGGYGQTGVMSTNILTRTVVVDGASVGGSVYGGSRFGNDNCVQLGNGAVSTTGFSKADTTIRVVSGNIASGSSGNVYGGGYRGYSYMDVHVYIGVPAMTSQTQSPAADYLHVNSVYGGASVGESQGSDNSAVLLLGDTDVSLGTMRSGSMQSSYSSFSVSGDVFGEGDYCSISGISRIEFRGFSQNGSLLSVQKADDVLILGSSLDIRGNVDGSSTQASERLSLNLIGDLVLQKDPSWGPSSLYLHSAASQVGGYGSLDENGDADIPEQEQYGRDSMNSLTLYDGMILSILGEGNTGTSGDLERIRGYTIIDNGGSTYYGTFAMGVTSQVDSGSAGFVVFQEGEPQAAQEAHYEYTHDGVSVEMTMWYIAGVYKVESTIILEDDGSDDVSASTDVIAPKTSSGSTIRFVGGYVNSSSPGSLDLVHDLEGSTAGHDFMVTVGARAGDNHIYFSEGGVTAWPEEDATFTGSGMLLNVEVSTLKGFDTTGYAGTVTLHMVEMLGNIPINTFDVEISIYLRTSYETGTITNAVVMRKNEGDGYIYEGSTDVYLPVMPGNEISDYYISIGTYQDGTWSSGSIPENGSLTLETVSTNLNKNGWQASAVQGEVSLTSSDESGLNLGTGGVFAPVIRFWYTYDSDSDQNQFEEIYLTLWIRDELTGEVERTYTIILVPELAEIRHLTFYDKYLKCDDQTGEISWSEHESVFTLELDFGTSMGDVYLAVSNSFANGGFNQGTWTAQDYISGVNGSIAGADGKVLMSDGEGGILTGTYDHLTGYLASNPDGSGYTVMSVEQFLSVYVDEKPSTEYGEDEPFSYSDYPNWYDTESCLSVFSFESNITNDLNVYAGYSITISIFVFSEEYGPTDPNKPFTVTPSVITTGLPGQEIDLGDLYETLSITAGYGAVSEGCIWWTFSDDQLNEWANVDEEGNYVYTFSPRADASVYLKLERVSYTIDMYVGQEGQDYEAFDQLGSNEYVLTVNGAVSGTSTAHFEDSVLIEFAWGDGTHHIGGVYGVTAGLGSTTDFEFSSAGTDHDVSFSMRAGNISVYVTMTDKKTVMVSLPTVGSSDNNRFGIEVSDSGTSLTISVVQDGDRRTQTVSTNAEAVSFEGSTTLGRSGFLVSVYVDGADTFVYADPSGITLDLSEYGDMVEMEVYVHVMWGLSISGSGYQVSVYRLTDPTATEGRFEVGSYDSQSSSPYVLTGDVLFAVSTGGNTLTSLTHVNLEPLAMGGTRLLYSFGGDGNPSLSQPVFRVVLTVSLTFYAGDDQIHLDGSGWSPTGSTACTSGDGSYSMGAPSFAGGSMVYTIVLPSGTYSVTASYDGFQSAGETITMEDSSRTLEIRVDAVEYTLYINGSAGVAWYVNNQSAVSEIVGDDDAAAWFASPQSDMSGSTRLEGDSPLSTGDFVDGQSLYIVSIPGFADQGEPAEEPAQTVVVVAVEGGLDGSHVVQAVEGIGNTSATVSIAGHTVSVSYTVSDDGQSATVTVTGCPDGTGAISLRQGDLVVVIVSVPQLEGVSP